MSHLMRWPGHLYRGAIAGLLVVGLPLTVLAFRPSSRNAAAPRAILAYGPLVPRRVVLADWAENAQFMRGIQGVIDVPEAALAGRPAVQLALFWGPTTPWDSAASLDTANLRPERANQRAIFYPARRTQPAVVVLRAPLLSRSFGGVRAVSDSARALLARHGVPVRIP